MNKNGRIIKMPIESPKQKLYIELITGSSCPACVTIKERLKRIINELNPEQINFREIDLLEEIDYAVDLGVINTPAIVLNGKLAFSAVPSLKNLRNTLQDYLK